MKKTKLFMLTIVVFSLAFAYNCKNENITNVYRGGDIINPINKQGIPAGTNIAFRDDFNGPSDIPDSFWTLCWPENTNNNDPAWNRFFKNTGGYECVRVEGGCLKLTAKKGKGLWDNLNYKTGGVWSSQNKYGIGTRIKVRAKLYQEEQAKTNTFNVPSAFPAIWYYPLFTPKEWPTSGEIDIMEWVNDYPNGFYSTIHATNTNTHKYLHPTQKTPKKVAEWHVYRCDWYSNNVVIYYDDEEVFRYTNNNKDPYPFNDNYYNIILNASLQKNWGTPVERNDSNLPYELWVDWVEVSLIDKITGKPLTKN